MPKNVKLTIAIFVAVFLIIPITAFLINKSNSEAIFLKTGSKHSSRPTIVLDSNDNPHLSWLSSRLHNSYSYDDFSINYIKKVDGEWVNISGEKLENKNSVVINNIGYARNENLILDKDDNPHFVWTNEHYNSHDGYTDIKYIIGKNDKWLLADGQKNHSESGEMTKGLIGQAPVLAVDNNCNPHVIYFGGLDEMDSSLKYSKWDDIGWVTAEGKVLSEENIKDIPIYPSWENSSTAIKIDKKGNPCVSWISRGKHEPWGDPQKRAAFFMKWDGKDWCNAGGQKYDATENLEMFKIAVIDCYGGFHDLELDSNDNPHIAWYGDAEEYGFSLEYGKLFYAKWNGDEWVDINGIDQSNQRINPFISGLGRWGIDSTSFVLDSNNNPHFLWTHEGKELHYSKWDGSKWVNIKKEENTRENTNITKSKYYVCSISFDLDSKDDPFIVWGINDSVPNLNKICYLEWNGKNWVTANGKVYR